MTRSWLEKIMPKFRRNTGSLLTVNEFPPEHKQHSGIYTGLLPVLAAVGLFWLLTFLYERDNRLIYYRSSTYFIWLAGGAGWCIASWTGAIGIKVVRNMLLLHILFYLLYILPYNPGHIDPLTMLYALTGLFFMFYSFRHGNGQEKSARAIIILAGVFSLQGLLQAFRHEWDPLSVKALFYNAGFFANFLVATIPLLFSGLLHTGKSSGIRAASCLLLLGFGLLVLFLTQARAAETGCLTGCACVVFICLPALRRRRNFILAILILAGVTLFLAAGMKTDSSRGRLTIYRVTLSMIAERPLTGIGADRFSSLYNSRQAAYFENQESSSQDALLADNTYEAFNIGLQVLAEYGAVGVFVLLYIAVKMWRSMDFNWIQQPGAWVKRGSAGCITGILFSAQFSNPFHVGPVLVLFVWHLSVVSARESLPVSPRPGANRWFSLFPFVLLMILSSLVFVKTNAENQWNRAAALAVCCGFEKAQVYYKKAEKELSDNGIFLFNYGAEACLAGKYVLATNLLERSMQFYPTSFACTYSGDSYLAMGNLNMAEYFYMKAAWMVPSHLVPKYKLVKLYQHTGEKAKEEFWRMKALSTPIKIPSNLTDELLEELREGGKHSLK